MSIEIGQPAPDFSLPDENKTMVGLDDLRGHKSVIVFIPFPFTGGCEGELCAIRDRLADLNDLDAKVVAITTDTVFTNKAWSERNGFQFPVLSDFWPHGSVTAAYGTFDDKVGAANRTTFILDEDGVVRAIIGTETRKEFRDVDDYVAALEAI